ncbi:MAG: PIN domain-containing protein [Aquabacterium sp.]|uniref:PIN domain-containing protein n=1 Tax=Aquabacterium sp. TaxID=1872578 RepID=UPI002719CE50|nr:PIN domain-containing protein [Aquabacterium sp.]MDO9004199.1 PIN domain-containing protein [Aquabacterium sp.]
MRINHVLIDLENVQPASLVGLDADFFHVTVFVGASQTKIPFELANAVQKFGARASYIKISGNGSNALDFHIAYYIGKLVQQDPTAYFHIISKDAGFDPLIQHIKAQKVGIARSKDIGDIPLLKAANSNTLQEKVAVVIANLRQRGASRPRTVKTLSSTILSLFQKQLPSEELAMLLTELQSTGVITINESKVSYALP